MDTSSLTPVTLVEAARAVGRARPRISKWVKRYPEIVAERERKGRGRAKRVYLELVEKIAKEKANYIPAADRSNGDWALASAVCKRMGISLHTLRDLNRREKLRTRPGKIRGRKRPEYFIPQIQKLLTEGVPAADEIDGLIWSGAVKRRHGLTALGKWHKKCAWLRGERLVPVPMLVRHPHTIKRVWKRTYYRLDQIRRIVDAMKRGDLGNWMTAKDTHREFGFDGVWLWRWLKRKALKNQPPLPLRTKEELLPTRTGPRKQILYWRPHVQAIFDWMQSQAKGQQDSKGRFLPLMPKASSPPAPRPKRKRGRPRGKLGSDPKADRRIAQAWGTGQYRSKSDLARVLKMTEVDVRQAIWRDKKRT